MTDDIGVSNDENDVISGTLKVGLNQYKIIKEEALMRHFPNLDEKELTICEMIVAAHHDFQDGPYVCIVSTTPIEHKIFRDEKDVEDTIKTLIDKRIVRARITSMTKERLGPKIPIAACNISLSLDNDVQDGIVGEMRKAFSSAVKRACSIDSNLHITKTYYAEKT